MVLLKKVLDIFFIEQGFCLIKMIEAGHKWDRVILTSPWWLYWSKLRIGISALYSLDEVRLVKAL